MAREFVEKIIKLKHGMNCSDWTERAREIALFATECNSRERAKETLRFGLHASLSYSVFFRYLNSTALDVPERVLPTIPKRRVWLDRDLLEIKIPIFALKMPCPQIAHIFEIQKVEIDEEFVLLSVLMTEEEHGDAKQ